jgi:serine/threonine protein phosphatase PrpC
MVCATCGLELRAGAKFCNHCGSRIAQPAAVAIESESSGSLAVPVNSAAVASSTPRPQAANITTHLDQSPTMILPTGQQAQEDGHIPAAAGASTAVETPSPPFTSSPPAASHVFPPADQLPWPLVVGIILDRRYRVEAVLQTADAENTYAVTDLRGYEQCWACGQLYGASAAGERYCRECGADLFARELIMVERPLPPGQEQIDDSAPSQPLLPGTLNADSEVQRFVQSGRAFEVRPRAVRHPNFPLGARLIAAATSDTGRSRAGDVNEDSALIIVLDRVHESRTLPLGVFAVADGLGGHASGNRASRQAIHVIAHTILRQLALPLVGSPSDPVLGETEISDLLTEAVRDANLALLANNKESGLDAGSTVVAALVVGDTAYIANVGDSRAYVLDQAGLRRITSDHSLVQQLVAGGLIEPDEVYTHPQRNQIFRSLGDEPDLTVDVFVQQLAPSMRILLCSDGLWEMVRDARIEELLRSSDDLQAVCDRLIDAANEGGGEDNITAVLFEAR